MERAIGNSEGSKNKQEKLLIVLLARVCTEFPVNTTKEAKLVDSTPAADQLLPCQPDGDSDGLTIILTSKDHVPPDGAGAPEKPPNIHTGGRDKKLVRRVMTCLIQA